MNVDLYSSTLENMIKGIARESSSFYIPLLIFNRDMHIFLCVFYGDMSIVIQIWALLQSAQALVSLRGCPTQI
jgi:hypothetical protein